MTRSARAAGVVAVALAIMSLAAAMTPQAASEPTASPAVQAATGYALFSIPPGILAAEQDVTLDDLTVPATPTPTPSASPAPKSAPKPAVKKYRDTVTNARAYVKAHIGATQYRCIDTIWARESQWDPRAINPSSRAYGIPQAKPGKKMAAFGSNWRYSPLTQVKWGMWYVDDRYGSACNALDFMNAHGWY